MGVVAQDPSGTLDYAFDFSEWLNDGETLESADWSVFPVEDGGLKQANSVHDNTVAGVWTYDGIAGHEYRLTCEIRTSQHRTTQRSITIRVQER